MNIALETTLIGGFLGVLTLIHFVVDWIFQSHAEAMVKHNNPRVRAKHCLIYTAGFVPFMLLLNFNMLEFVAGLNILFWSHFVEDTYIPVFLWAKYIRKPPEMEMPRKETAMDKDGSTSTRVLIPDPHAGFIQFVSTPLGKILMIVIDQIIHLLFLLPIAWMALQHINGMVILQLH